MEQLNMNSALNRGLKETRGSYVQFLDDDDKIKPDKIERQVNLLESSPEVGMVYSGFETESGKEYYPSPEVRGPVLKYALQFGVSTWKTSTWLVDRDIVRKITPFDEELVASTDLKKLIKMAQHTHFDYIDDLLVIQGDPEEETRLGDSAEAIEGRMQILDEFRHLYTKFDNSVYDSARSETYYLRGMQEFDKNIWSKIAILSFARAVYHSPSVNPNLIATLAASMFGRPGLSYARKLKELTL
jgi:glycosyltransferase involved in cell wall biosynthesis